MKKYIYYWISVLFMLAVASNATAWSKKYQEEFHKTYPLSATGQVEVSNVNGDVIIQVWDRNEVQVDAIKYASSKDALEETEIVISSKTDEIRIKTEFPSSKFWGNNHESSVDYTISVPKNADLNDISLVNGNLEINNAGGTVNASTVNGALVAKDLSGETKLSTVNGTMDVDFSQLNVSKVSLSSVNGEVQLKLPSNADAKISASTVNGGISNEFGLEIDKHRWVGADLSGVIGSGHTRIDLNSVNGKIAILKK
jgi:DUF4097 and DUF4098 domain-containing protein YvlB